MSLPFATGVLPGSRVTRRTAHLQARFLVCDLGVGTLALCDLFVALGFSQDFGSGGKLPVPGIRTVTFSIGQGMLFATLQTLALSHGARNRGSAATIASLSFLAGAMCSALVAPANGLQLGRQPPECASLSGICLLAERRMNLARQGGDDGILRT